MSCTSNCGSTACWLTHALSSNQAVKQHITTTRGLFPHKRITRKSEMTAKGIVITELEEDISALPSGSGSGSNSGHAASPSTASNKSDEPARKSPIAELLYMRWLEGLKMKWPAFS